MSRQLRAVAMVWQDCSRCMGHKREQPEEHLRTGFNAWAFSHLLAVLSTLLHFNRDGLSCQLRKWQLPEQLKRTGVVKWIIHVNITL